MVKRVFDIVASVLALALLSPLLLPIALVLRLTGEGKVFYLQERIGRRNKVFLIYKFATMLEDSPNLPGGDITVCKDPRILPIGHFLRKTKINELPQLLNVIRGDMSIIGPRPLTKRVAALFPAGHWANVAELRPGLSGIGSIVFRDEETLLSAAQDRQTVYAEQIVPYKLALESWYARNQNFALDLMLIFLTLEAILSPNFEAARWLKNLPSAPEALSALRKKTSFVRDFGGMGAPR
jgi:lipopolysaccharide/colanic/teichoic acid biosynthesis glycosyltransferase